MRRIMGGVLAILTFAGLSSAGFAAAQIQSGTGFFVSNTGHIITNEHVVHGCSKVMVRGSVSPSTAYVLDVDTEYDLALLRAESKPRRIANIRRSDDAIMINDPLMVIGYPLNHGVTGIYKVEYSQVLDLAGPTGEPKWIQFAHAALQGNSGGPLLDSSGNVIGVVVGKTRLLKMDAETGEPITLQQSDVAISLPVLKAFLNKNRVYFQAADSRAYYSVERVENSARNYIVNIHCRREVPQAK